MTHQGPDWLDKKFALEAYSEVNPAGRFAVHLFGHMHESTLRSDSTGGGKIVRKWQGNSLFGLEKFGEPPQIDRRHGYAAGRIEFDSDGATIRHWPRRAIKGGNGWRFHPDQDSYVLVEGDSCTVPERLENVTKNSSSWNRSNNATSTTDLRRIRETELQLEHALQAFKGQPTIFLEPKLSKTREFNDEENEIHKLIEEPRDTLIVAPPEFGLTCLGIHLQLVAFKKSVVWLYIDSEQTKGRKISDHIDEKLLHHEATLNDLKCILVDSWNGSNTDHLTMVRNIEAKCPAIPIILLAEDDAVPDLTASLSKLNRNFDLLHLQALSRKSMRQLVAGYNATKLIGKEDVVLSGLADHLEAINVHRTPLNCYTLLRVLDSSYNEKLLNKSKLLRAFLFVLFTDSDSFSYLSSKPEVEECTYVLGNFCKDLILERTRSFDATTFTAKLRAICSAHSIVLDIGAMLNVLLENNILVRRGDQMEFRHRYWVLYFAGEWMHHDDEFRRYIFKDRKYVGYPEIIEFYSGVDGKRADALEALLADLTALTDEVGKKIGIDRSFDPLSLLLWDPSDEFLTERCIENLSPQVEFCATKARLDEARFAA